LTADSSQNLSPAINTDSTKVAFASDRDDGNLQISTMGIDGSSQTNVSNNACDELAPSWSPDRAQLVFVSRCSGKSQLVKMNANGSNRVVIVPNRPSGLAQIWVMNANGTVSLQLLTPSPTGKSDTNPVWSPDGTNVAFSTHDGAEQP